MDENLISNISYTSKDFNTIYPELLDLVKKLTNRWDPSLSNESDPGVLLLKLNALIADKNNYNIDKNILECFPLSVTQEGNARRLYDMLGYTMHWYRSATTTVSFQLRSTENIPSEGYTIPQFTSLVDSTGESIYTILNNVILTSAALNTPVTATAIEGVVYDYTIDDADDTTLITIANLDNDLRLYFSDQMIAENGIFITDANNTGTYPTEYNGLTGIWHRVDNIDSYPLGEYVYQFGVLPNSNTCYIQFPQDVASLIENGIRIKYTVTKGAQGNIKANILSLFYEDQESSSDDSNEDSIINEDIRILQPYAADNGLDPESIDDAYRNYKRTIGTFNTLVTERDYENYIYSLNGEGNRSLISNIVVADRTDDINYSDHIQVWYPSGSRQELQIKDDQLNAYNIVLYLLRQPQSIYDKSTYDESFSLCTDNIVMQDISVALEDSQSVQHDILFVTDDILNSNNLIRGKKVSIENTIALTGSLITYNKVSKAEASDIEKAVLSALYRTYNARNVTFGSQIEYEDLVSTIQNADSRIKTVILNIPTYTPKYNIITNNESGIQSFDPNTFIYEEEEKVLNNELVARMIVAGNVQLFKFDTDFNYDFGQKDANIVNTNGHEIIKSITSSTKIEISKDENNPTIIKENEVLQIIEPSLVTDTEYSTYVRYWINTSDSSYTIPANRDVAIEYPLHLRYLDATTNAYVNIVLPVGTIINSTIDVGNKADSSETSYSSWSQISSGNNIKVRKLNQSQLSIGTKYYFITNTSDNRLYITADNPKILQENEYFIYTNSNTDELIIYGSGTELSIGSNSTTTFDEHIELLDLSEINSDNIENINWLTLTQDLYVTELKITNVATGSQVYAEIPSTETNTETIIAENTSKSILNSEGKDYITYHIIDESNNETTIYPSIIQNSPNLIQSRLYINANQFSPQVLSGDQSFKFTFVDVDELTGETIKDENGEDIVYEGQEIKNTQILFNNPIILSGGENIDVQVLDDYGQYLYSLKAMSYESVDISNTTIPEGYSEATNKIQRNTDDLIILNRTTLPSQNTDQGLIFEATIDLNFTFNSYQDASNSYMIPIYVALTGRSSAPYPTIQITGVNESESEVNFTIYGTQVESPANFSSSNNSLIRSYVIKSPNTSCNSMRIRITNFRENDSLTIGNIFKLDGYNIEDINITDLNYTYDITETANDVIKRIQTILPDPTIFNWTYIVPEVDKVLNPTLADSYWNENHIYNKYTIPKIDFSNTKIKINPSTIIQ